jgi:cytochrome c oxidase cbb3-type subunit III
MVNDDHDHKKEIDSVTGVETTGHEWDGIKELNNPAPRWWLWVFFITFIWSIGYWVIYPAWPTLSGEGTRGATKGSEEWTSYKQLGIDQKEIVARQDAYMEKFSKSSFEDVMKDPALYEFAMAGGAAAFKDNCSVCHGTGGAGGNGYPNLNDDDWIWGGTLNDIHTTLLYGIRAGHESERNSMMPEYKDMLSLPEKNAVAEYVSSLSLANDAIDIKMVQQGKEIFAAQCSVCHGDNGKGGQEVGAPNLSDAIWLHGDIADKDIKGKIISQLNAPKHGVMPYWQGRLSPQTIRQLTIYVHELGGGK